MKKNATGQVLAGRTLRRTWRQVSSASLPPLTPIPSPSSSEIPSRPSDAAVPYVLRSSAVMSVCCVYSFYVYSPVSHALQLCGCCCVL